MNHDESFLTIRRLFTADDTKLDTESLLLFIRLLIQRADEKSTFLAHSTLARQLRCSESTIADRMKELKGLGMIAIKSGKRINMPNDVTVLLAKLPQGDLKPSVVSDAARKVAAAYKTVI